jgi:hypothetical protein
MTTSPTETQQLAELQLQTRTVIQSLRKWCDTAEVLVNHPTALAALARGLLVPQAAIVHLDTPVEPWSGVERRSSERRLHAHPSEGNRRRMSAVPPLDDE